MTGSSLALSRLLGRQRDGARHAAGAVGDALLAAIGRVHPQPVPSAPRSILVLRNNDLGDLLVVTPLFAALRRRFPEAEIVAAVGRWNVPVLQGNPHLTAVAVTDAPWANKFVRRQGIARRLAWVAFAPAARELARRRFDVGIDVLGSRWGALLLLRAGVRYRLGMRGYAGGHTAMHRTVAFDPHEHVGRSALRFAELLGATDLPPCRPQLFLTEDERASGEAHWPPGRRIRIVVGPGAGLPAKAWPLERWVALVGRLKELGAVDVAAVGGPADREVCERLAHGSGAHDLGGLGLRETFALVAAADLVFCNSSMLMHAAAAFEKPAIVLLGPSFSSARQHDAQWGYLGTCISLGKEPGVRDELATPEEALVAARALLAATPRREVA